MRALAIFDTEEVDMDFAQHMQIKLREHCRLIRLGVIDDSLHIPA